MKRGWVASLVMTGVIALAAWANTAESRAAPETVAVRLCYEDVDVRPWRYRRGGGLDFQLLDRAGKRAGVSFQYEAMPWQECLARLRANEVDGVFGENFPMEASLGDSYASGRRPDASSRLHLDSENTSHLVLAREFSNRRPELAKHIWQSIEAVRASAAYQILERQTLTMLGKA